MSAAYDAGGAAALLILIRHGETQWNAQSRIQGHIDTSLSDAGLTQVRALVRGLRAEALAAVYTSDLARARETAQPLAHDKGLELRVDPRLRERGFGLFEGSTYEQAQRRWPTEYAVWARRDPGHALPGGESTWQVRERVFEALAQIVARHAGSAVAVVTHGGVLDVVYRAAMGIAWEAPRLQRMPNAAIHRVRARLLPPAPAAAPTVRLDLEVQAWAQDEHLKDAPQDDPAGIQARDELP